MDDTSPAARAVLLNLLRKASPARKMQTLWGLQRMACGLNQGGWVVAAPEPSQALIAVIDALEALAVPYFVAGSFASTLYGEVRTTLDADIVTQLTPEQAAALAHYLSDEFYADEEMMRLAAAEHGSFNLIHLATMFKVDVFMPVLTAFEQSQFARRVRHPIDADGMQPAYFASAEDVILAKLRWYQAGGGTSERQLRDVLGVMRVSGPVLDRAYLGHMAAHLGLSGLLHEAWSQANV